MVDLLEALTYLVGPVRLIIFKRKFIYAIIECIIHRFLVFPVSKNELVIINLRAVFNSKLTRETRDVCFCQFGTPEDLVFYLRQRYKGIYVHSFVTGNLPSNCSSYNSLIFQSPYEFNVIGKKLIKKNLIESRALLPPTAKIISQSKPQFGEQNEIKITCIGTISPRKRQIFLLSVLTVLARRQSLPIWRCYIAGAQDLNQKDYFRDFRNSVADCYNEGVSVRYLGFLDPKEARSLVARSDIIILLSEKEGLPYFLREAMGQGKAIVCTEIPGVIGSLSDNFSVDFVSNPPLISQVVEKLARLISSPDRRKYLGNNARAVFNLYHRRDVYVGNVRRLVSLKSLD